jgi:hypothetical protein
MKQIGEKEADELEGHAYHAVPYKRENGSYGESIDVYFVTGHAWGDNGGLPVGWRRISCGLFISGRLFI